MLKCRTFEHHVLVVPPPVLTPGAQTFMAWAKSVHGVGEKAQDCRCLQHCFKGEPFLVYSHRADQK